MDFLRIIEGLVLLVWSLWTGPPQPGCYWATGDIEVRIEHCSELLGTRSIHPQHQSSRADIYVQRGHHYLELRKFAAAIEDADNALSLVRNYADALELRADAQSEAGAFEPALADLNKLIELHPKKTENYIRRGIVHRRQGDFEKALADYGKAIEIDPKGPSAFHTRAWAHYLKGRHADALRDSDMAVELSSSHPEARSTRAHILLALGRKSEALAEFTYLAQNGPAHLVRRYQQILKLRGYVHIEETGESSDELVAGIQQCIQEGCIFMFDVETLQSSARN